MTPPAPTPPDRGAPLHWLLLVGVMTTAVLALSLPWSLFDTNFYSLFEATSLLEGDHPYRDFFEWGIPLQAALSALVQRAAGNRMIGEFIVIHWSCIVAGAVLSFDVGYRLNRSVAVSLVMAVVAVLVLPDTPTYHYPKLLLYPLTIWLAWRYMNRPTLGRSIGLGLVTAVAFLFRHDHGAFVGVGAVLASGLTRWTAPERTWRLALRHGVACTATVLALLVPWLVLVNSGEGIVEYVRTRAPLYARWSAENPYGLLLWRHPFPLARGWAAPPPKPGVASFIWNDGVDVDQRSALEERLGLRSLAAPDENGQRRYQVANLYDRRLWSLSTLTHDTSGLDWRRLEELNSWLPTREPAREFLAQVVLLVPFALLASVGLEMWRARRQRIPLPATSYGVALVALFLAVADERLFREPSYSHLVTPLTAALAGRLFIVRRGGHAASPPAIARPVVWARLAVAASVLGVTALAALACLQPRELLTRAHVEAIPDTMHKLLVSPPIDAFATLEDVATWTSGQDRQAWIAGGMSSDRANILLRYMHDCTTADDRVLVTGSTPFHVNYLVGRPIAGGHAFWYHGWRADPRHEAELLAILNRQSVPFAFSTHDPVMDDLRAYPNVHARFAARYAPLPGSAGLLLVDKTRRPTSHFGPYDFPCFK